ncbi:hypothetical protein [Streptosporangium sp. NPDC023615]|uniref:hypothetical protein n=1 Tax=Streptosporangium sp. NPDC023615 TaxID=3154794 RepID=UPI003413265E
MRIRAAVPAALVPLVALAVLQGVSACSPGEPGAWPRTASPRSPSPSVIAPAVSATPRPSGTFESSAAPRSSPVAATVRCETAVGGEPTPSGDLGIIDDAVALPTSEAYGQALQVSEVRLPDGGKGLFAKQGLLVRRGQHVELTVPEAMTGRLWMAWGRPGRLGARVVVDRCEARDEWIAFVGGYTVREAGCLPILVSVNGGTAREVRVGIGAPCPGQRPAPRP